MLNIFEGIDEARGSHHWPAKLDQKTLRQYLGNIDTATLKRDYTCKPDFPTGIENEKKPVWHRAAVDQWLAAHDKPYKDVMTKW
ncbi:hypothetical protein [Fructilactobacillus florum]|uniref:Uncharacterized protein n=1 Tax=Fructilactobacillus florum DSM 22689 = JCM 16035 TaxID=1423745 RepID=A0A0R2CIJ6_9LACO|nr:hypothetical protein [Fructilactobacillus florum]KRM89812.1 hypothetical protein FC87_GL000329 [Fructilactobacillus florum DSM 22689 = JCM 16035]